MPQFDTQTDLQQKMVYRDIYVCLFCCPENMLVKCGYCGYVCDTQSYTVQVNLHLQHRL